MAQTTKKCKMKNANWKMQNVKRRAHGAKNRKEIQNANCKMQNENAKPVRIRAFT
jgi:hypothetical protein